MNSETDLPSPGSASPGTLHVLATPLGHLGDLSPRAREILASVDLIACEDTRHSGKLLAGFAIRTPTVSYHEHNETAQARSLLNRLLRGRNIALISNAGTPLVSDPGYRLVHLCRKNRVPVSPVPGPSAPIAALSVSGLPTDRFLFAGFLPRQSGSMRRELEALQSLKATLILHVAPHRLAATLELAREVLGDRQACLAREMTKIHESFYLGTLSAIRSRAGSRPKGECTLVIQGAASRPSAASNLDLEAYVGGLMQVRGLTRTQAVRSAARALGLRRREVYRRCLEAGELSGGRDEADQI